MKINDYILKEDVIKLTDDEYKSFRRYLRFLGFSVHGGYGRKFSSHSVTRSLVLDFEGDLVWSNKIGDGKRITLEEVYILLALGDFHED